MSAPYVVPQSIVALHIEQYCWMMRVVNLNAPGRSDTGDEPAHNESQRRQVQARTYPTVRVKHPA